MDDILARVNIENLFREGGAQGGKAKGDQHSSCRCPFCGDDSHFGFHAKKGLWKCYKCEESGNLNTFVARTRGISTGEAFKQLLGMAGLKEEAAPKERRSRNSGKPGADKPTGTTSAQDAPLPTGDTRIAAIYEAFINLLPLTDADREHLHKKRGFTDATIDAFKIRSGGAHTEDIMAEMRTRYAESDLIESALLVNANGRTIINDQLLGDRLIIPYIDESGEVYHVRPHKLGFKQVPLQPFCSQILANKPEHIVLTEGEFKAIALQQWQVPALAVPGVQSFGLKNFDRLVTLLREFGVKRVTVIFDNEIKDNPEYPNYKPRVEDRHDTQLWSHLMAYKLEQAGFVTRVGTLPGEWRENGKVDFDMALAQGRTREEILAVIGAALSAREYLERLPDDARRIVQRKKAMHYTRLNIARDFNRYVVTKFRDGQPQEQVISNFVINIKASFYTPDGVMRNVQLVNEYGEASGVFALDPGSMAGLNEWKKFLLSKGNYVFEGAAHDLINVWKLEFLRDSGEMIYMPSSIGRVEPGLWLFGNMAIRDGKAYRPDNDGVAWVNGKGYRPQSLQLNPQGQAMEDAIPALSTRPINIREVAAKLKEGVGGYEAYIGLGWVIATLFAEDIFAAYKCLPILFPHGKRESGKSTYMRWLMNFFGIESEGYGIAETTQNFIARALSYYSGLGVWFDEYRNEPRVTSKDGFFRSAYNRQLSGKGTATAFQAKGFSVNAALSISGEELPRDNGLYTRLVPIQISANKRNREHFEWLNRHCTSFSSFSRETLLQYNTHKDKLLQNIAEMKQVLVARDVSDRTAENWAICAASFDTLVLQDDSFLLWVEEKCQEIRRTGEQEHILNQFWEDVNVLLSQGDLNQRHLKLDEGALHVWFPGVFDVWSVHYRRKTGREPFDRVSVLKYLTDEPYCSAEQASVRMDRTKRRTYVVDPEIATDTIREIAAAVDEMQWQRNHADKDDEK